MRLVLALWALFAVAGAHAAAGSKKANRLYEMSAGAAAVLTDHNYEKFALDRDRDYHLFVLFTARESRYQCSVCGEMESEFLTTASSFWRMGENADRRDVFFAVVDYPTAVTTFQKHKFTSVPMVVHHEPSTTGLSGKARYVIKPGQVYQVTDTGIDAESLARFVKQHVRAEIEIYRSPLPRILFALAFLGLAGVLVKFALDNVHLVLQFVRAKWMWRTICFIVYGFSISGFVFDIIRNPPPFYCRGGQCMFIHPQSGTQFVAEGFIIGGLNLAAAYALVMLWKRFPDAKDGNARAIRLLVAAVGFALLYSQVVALYRFKSPWYPYRLLF